MAETRDVVETPTSAFVREMNELMAAFCEADSKAERKRLKQAMTDTMNRFFPPSHGGRPERVAHEQRRYRRTGHRVRPGRRWPEGFDPKLAAAGRDE